jgi:hypothetical protein
MGRHEAVGRRQAGVAERGAASSGGSRAPTPPPQRQDCNRTNLVAQQIGNAAVNHAFIDKACPHGCDEGGVAICPEVLVNLFD